MLNTPDRLRIFHPQCHRCLGNFEPGASHCPRCHFEVHPSWRTALLDTLAEHAPEIYCGVVLWFTVMAVIVYYSVVAGVGVMLG